MYPPRSRLSGFLHIVMSYGFCVHKTVKCGFLVSFLLFMQQLALVVSLELLYTTIWEWWTHYRRVVHPHITEECVPLP